MSKHSIRYCGIMLEYTLTRKKVKNINLRIHPDGEVCLSAPQRMTVAEIDAFVSQKAEWIIRHLAEVDRYNRMRPDGALYTGKTVYVLGKAYQVEVAEAAQESILLLPEGRLLLQTPYPEDEDAMKKQYLSWLLAESQAVFAASLERMRTLAAAEAFPMPTLSVRNMKSRWGSCKVPAQKITLNLQLMKADCDCIDQVMLHELVHFKEIHHNEAFYAILSRYLPDWKERKERLETQYKDGIS